MFIFFHFHEVSAVEDTSAPFAFTFILFIYVDIGINICINSQVDEISRQFHYSICSILISDGKSLFCCFIHIFHHTDVISSARHLIRLVRCCPHLFIINEDHSIAFWFRSHINKAVSRAQFFLYRYRFSFGYCHSSGFGMVQIALDLPCMRRAYLERFKSVAHILIVYIN